MYGLGAVTTLGVRIGKEINEHLTQASKTLSKDRYRTFTKSEIARRILADFFDDKKEFRTEYAIANAKKPFAGRTNVKQKRRRKR